MNTPQQQQTSHLKVAAAWILVTIPLGWGVYQSVVKSLPLFQMSASTTVGRAQSPRVAQ